MINNKQVNIWRGIDPPPTIYHVWIYNDSQLRLYNEEKETWTIFIDDIVTIAKMNEVLSQLDIIEQDIGKLGNNTINGKAISTNPVLNGDDLKVNKAGNFFSNTDTLSTVVTKIDTLLNTQIID